MSAQRFAETARTLAGLSAWALGWRPEEFWRATPDELVAALNGPAPAAAAAPDREAIASLQAMFPDGVETSDG